MAGMRDLAGALVLVLLLGWGGGAAAQGDAVGRVTVVEGRAVALRGDVRTLLTADAPVYRDDRIRTGPAARLGIAFTDGSTLAVGSDSLVAVSDYAVASGGAVDATISLFMGILRAVVAPGTPPGGFEVQTRAAVASVRSTEFVVTVERDDAHMAAFAVSGMVAVIAPAGTVVLEPGFGTDVDVGEAPVPPREWGAGRVREVLARTRLP
jgi:hypothetical protein